MWIQEFLLKYWLEFLLGIIAAAITANFKAIKSKIVEYRSMKRSEENQRFKENMVDAMKPMIEELAQRSDSNDAAFREELCGLQTHLTGITNRLDTVTTGMLNVQGNIFKGECKDILRQTELITEAQYEKCMSDHAVYNSLGGNSDGDRLYELVTAKYEHQITQ